MRIDVSDVLIVLGALLAGWAFYQIGGPILLAAFIGVTMLFIGIRGSV